MLGLLNILSLSIDVFDGWTVIEGTLRSPRGPKNIHLIDIFSLESPPDRVPPYETRGILPRFDRTRFVWPVYHFVNLKRGILKLGCHKNIYTR